MTNKKIEFETYKNMHNEVSSLKKDNPSHVNFLSYKKTKITIEEIEESNDTYIERLTEMLKTANGYTSTQRIKEEITRLQKQIPNVSSFEAFSEFVNNMDLNKSYKIVVPFYYEIIRVDKNSETTFSWSLGCNYKVSGRTGYSYPMASNNFVKQFKTEAGAKKSLIKHCEFLFKKEND